MIMIQDSSDNEAIESDTLKKGKESNNESGCKQHDVVISRKYEIEAAQLH
jgi:hypothetical protein